MQSGASRKLRELAYTALASALIAVSALITVPLPSAVAITLQTFGVYFALFFLGGRLGTCAVALYIAIGSVGLPVFSGFSGGVGRLFDAGGGFILGFLIAALVYWLLTCLFGARLRILFAVITLLLLYAVGALWYSFVYLGAEAADFVTALAVTVLPFIIPDALKIALAEIIARRLHKIIKKTV
jgi:biotin transport system substrate-specific component